MGFTLNCTDEFEQKLNKREVGFCDNKVIITLKYLLSGNITAEEKELLQNNDLEGVSTFFSYFYFKTISELFGKEKTFHFRSQFSFLKILVSRPVERHKRVHFYLIFVSCRIAQHQYKRKFILLVATQSIRFSNEYIEF